MKELNILAPNGNIHKINIPKESVNIHTDDFGIHYQTPMINGIIFLNHYNHLGFKPIISSITS